MEQLTQRQIIWHMELNKRINEIELCAHNEGCWQTIKESIPPQTASVRNRSKRADALKREAANRAAKNEATAELEEWVKSHPYPVEVEQERGLSTMKIAMSTVFCNLTASQLATAIGLHGKDRKTFMRTAWNDGGAYGEAARVHFDSRFAPNVKANLGPIEIVFECQIV